MLSFDHTTNSFLVDGRPAQLSPQETQELESISWWHTIRFSPTMATHGHVEGAEFISTYLLDHVDFRGKSVADIGCWDGFQVFYAESQGASRVVGIDDPTQRHSGTAGRELSRRVLRSQAEFIDCNIYDLDRDLLGTFDIVMLFGVLYHLKHPLLGIEKAASLTTDTLLLSTHFLPSPDPFPWCVLYPGSELDNDPTNWSGPNMPWLRHALQGEGLVVKEERQYAPDRVTLRANRTDSLADGGQKLSYGSLAGQVEKIRE